MNLTGGRTTLILNICALVLALIINTEGTYIVYRILGLLKWSDWVVGFIPVLVMFVVRNRGFSFIFLLLHIALALQMFYQSIRVYLGTYESAGAKYPLGYLALFFLVSLVCLAVYGAAVLVLFAARTLARKLKSSKAD